MKLSRQIATASLVLATLAAAAAAAPKTTVSVMDLNTSSGLSRQELVLLTDKLLNSLVEYRVFEVVERSKRDEILKEQGFQMTGACSEASCLVEVGQLLGAQKMIGGTIGTLGGIYVAELRMIDIKTGGIDLTFSRNYGKIADLLSAMKEAAEIFSSWKPSGGGQSAKPGGLFIVSEPEGAKILVDGSERPRTTPDLVYPLAEGLHQVSLVKDGFSLYSASRLVSVGKIDTLSAPLMSLAGKLRIAARPTGAKIYLGNAFQGLATEQPMVIEDLSDSAYQLRIQKWGYRRYQSRIRTNPGRETKVNASLPLARWKLRWAFDYMKPFSPSTESATSVNFGSSPSSPGMTISEADFQDGALGGTIGVGVAVTRNIAISGLYQFRAYPKGIKKNEFVTNWPAATNDDLEMGLTTHSVLGAVTVFVPWGRVEPFIEVRGGGLLGAKASGEFERKYETWSAANATYVEDSVRTEQLDATIKYSTLQAGGGIKLWTAPRKPALRIYWMYNIDWFKDVPQPLTDQKANFKVTGFIFGAGASINF